MTTLHPAPETLTDFGLGLLDSVLHLEVEVHLGQCEDCQRFLEELPGDTFTQHFQQKELQTVSSRWEGEAPAEPQIAREPRTDARRQPRYDILGELGRGGMGVVFKARDRKLNRLVALKKIRNGSLANREEHARFLREASLAARLIHPGIVQIYEVGEEPSEDGLPIPYFAMELVEGESLANRLSRGRLSEKDAVALVETLARTIHAAHDQGVVHRDLKPANILIHRPRSLPSQDSELSTQDLSLKVADFGLAKCLRPTGQTMQASGLSVGGVMMGTPGYMAPEQIRGVVEELGVSTDVYALGAILYECVTGQTPHPKESSWSALEGVLKHDPPPPRGIRPGLSADLEAICLKCLEQEPRQRYASALALSEDLRRLAHHEPIEARPATTMQRASKWIRRHPWPTALAVLLLLMAIGIIIGLTVHTLRLQDALTRIESAKARADANYRQARQAIQQMLSRINDLKAYQLEGARQLHSKQLEDALAFHEKALADMDADQPLVQLDTAETLIDVATLQTTLSRHAEAEVSLRRALRLIEQLPDTMKEKQASEMAAWNKLGSVLLSLGKANDAIECYGHSRQLVKQLLEADPESLNLQHDLAWTQHNLGTAYTSLHQYDKAQEALQRAITFRQDILRRHPGFHPQSSMLAESQANLAMVLHLRGQKTEALKTYTEAETTLRQLVQQVPDQRDYGVSLAALKLNRGNLLGELGKVTDALQSYREGLRLVQETLKLEPLHDRARQLQIPLHGACANLLQQTGRADDALVEWDRAIALAGTNTRQIRCMRCTSLALVKQHETLLKEVEQLMGDKALSPLERWYLLVAVEAALPLAKEAGKVAKLKELAGRLKPQ